MSIEELDEEQFVARFGALFEHSPWVAREAWRRCCAPIPSWRAARRGRAS